MDKSASVLAALNAGKLPSHNQASQALDALLNSAVLTANPSADGGELSQQGKVLQNDVRAVLVAYKHLFDDKNGDSLLQEALWNLSEADISSTSTALPVDTDSEDAAKDSRAIARALRTLVSVVWENLSQEGRSVFHDFSSFMRLALADAADHVAHTAGHTADSLRDLDNQVEQGERDEIGTRKRKAPDDADDADAKVKFEKTMDSTKQVGSKAIGAGQAASASAQDVSNRTSSRLQDAYLKICDRAQDDPEYHNAITTLFDLAQKWVDRSLDAARDVNQATSLDAFIDDPTSEKHLITGIRLLRSALERLAGGKSLDDFFCALRVVGVDIQQDEDVRRWYDTFFAHLRRSLDERGYARSDEAERTRKTLRREWKELLDADSDKGRKWKEDIGVLKRHVQEFESAIERDGGLKKVRKAHAKLGEDLEQSLFVAGNAAQALADKAPWFWQDMFNVYLPKAIGMLKDIPIPRTEYKDAQVEFVLEDVDISSFALLPGHAYIRNITDIDITAPAAGETNTAVGTMTRVYVQALQLALREVSFYYNDKTAMIGPAEFTGVLEFTLPPQGIDINIVVRTIPDSPAGLKERETRGGVLDIQRVEAKISEDVDLTIRQSNHPILVSMFRPVMLSRFREALANSSGNTDQGGPGVNRRSRVGHWSALRGISGFGPRSRGQSSGSAMERAGSPAAGRGWGMGRVACDGHRSDEIGRSVQFAIGAEPQVLSGEKRGPKGVEVDESVEAAKGIAEEAKTSAQEGVRKARSFSATVEATSAEERKRSGWQSAAFDAA